MKNFFLLFLSFSFCQSYAQKITVKDELVLVDDKPYIHIEKEGCKVLSPECTYKIKNTSDKPLIVITSNDIYMPEKIEQSNPKGRVVYSRFVFLDSIGQKAEIEKIYLNTEKLIKFILKNNLVKDDVLDADAVRTFVLVNGTPFTDRNGRK